MTRGTLAAAGELEARYARHCLEATAMAPHLPTLRALAAGLELAIELGVKRGASTTALLLGARRVISVDWNATKEARELGRLVGADRWTYEIDDSRTIALPACDLLLLDSLHTYEQVAAELEAHADNVGRFLVFHDVTTFGEVAADGETGRQAWTYEAGRGSVPAWAYGIRPAIDELMIRDPSWQIRARYVAAHGLLVLERVQP